MSKALDLLLVDDDEVDRNRVLRLLGSQYQVYEAATGREALTAIAAQRPDCILLDYRLPDTDGLALLPQFRARGLPVIILTGEENPEIIVQAMQLGAQNYLVKAHLSRVALDHAILNALDTASLRRDLEQKNVQLRVLASELTLAEQRERQRISQTLHDHLQQMLYSIQMRSYLIGEQRHQPAKIEEHLQALELLIHDAIQITRTLTVELSPPMLQRAGLAAALQWLAEHMEERHGLHVVVDARTTQQRVSEELQVLLFQLVRELLFNVVKHAGVSEASVVLCENQDRLQIQVIDFGCGFEPEDVLRPQLRRADWGLYSMGERLTLFDGQLLIESQPEQGVRATISVPQPVE